MACSDMCFTGSVEWLVVTCFTGSVELLVVIGVSQEV